MTATASRRSSASISARPRSRPVSSPSTAGCSALARSGYGARRRRRAGLGRAGPGRLVVRGGQRRPGAACRATSPRSWRSASTATARRSPPSTRAARPPARRSRSSTPARRPRPTSWPGDRRPRLGAGRPAGGAVGRAPRARRRSGDLLVPLDLGVARVPPDRGRDRARSSRTRRVPALDRVAAAGVAVDRLPPRTATGATVGELTDTAADALGLRPGIPVVGGTVDAFASYLGGGPARARRRRTIRAARPAGSASTGTGRSRSPAGSSRRRRSPDGTASARRWRRRAVRSTGIRDDILGGTITTEALLAEAAATPPGADGLVFLPYLAGERSPIWDPEARGVLAGLTLAHGRGHIAAGDRRGVRAGDPPRRRADARGRRRGHRDARLRRPGAEPFWNAVKADVTGFHVAVPAVLETAVLGSAILGAVGIGAYADLPAAIGAMTRIASRIEPRRELAAALRPAVRGVRRPCTRRPRRSCGRSARVGMTRPRATHAAGPDEPAVGPALELRDRLRLPERRDGGPAAGPRRRSTSTSRAAGSSPSSARTAAASPRSCGSSPGSSARPRAPRGSTACRSPAPTRGSAWSSRSRACCRGGRRRPTSPTRSSSPAGPPNDARTPRPS